MRKLLIGLSLSFISFSSFAEGVTNLCNASEKAVVSCQNSNAGFGFGSVKVDVCQSVRDQKLSLAMLRESTEGGIAATKITANVKSYNPRKLELEAFDYQVSYNFFVSKATHKARIEIDFGAGGVNAANLNCK